MTESSNSSQNSNKSPQKWELKYPHCFYASLFLSAVSLMALLIIAIKYFSTEKNKSLELPAGLFGAAFILSCFATVCSALYKRDTQSEPSNFLTRDINDAFADTKDEIEKAKKAVLIWVERLPENPGSFTPPTIPLLASSSASACSH